MSEDANTPADPGTSEEQIKDAVIVDEVAPVLSQFGMIAPEMMRTLSGSVTNEGHGYEFTPAQVDSAIKKFEDVAERTAQAGDRLAAAISQVAPPAQDGPSTRHAEGARASLQRAQQHNRTLREYAEDFLKKLHAAKAGYADAEHHNASNANRQM
ncbi:MAG: PE domain-containing protein [Sciscionella sp.]